MKYPKLFLAAGALLALASCGGSQPESGTKVDYSKFVEEAEKIEEHQYKTAAVKATGYATTLGQKFDFNYDLHFEYQSDTETGTSGFVCTDDIDETDTLKVSTVGQITVDLQGNVDVFVTSATDEQKKNFDFYINPFRVAGSISIEGEIPTGGTVKNNVTQDITFDKYGYVIKVDRNVVNEISIDGETTSSTSVIKFTVTYAD